MQTYVRLVEGTHVRETTTNEGIVRSTKYQLSLVASIVDLLRQMADKTVNQDKMSRT